MRNANRMLTLAMVIAMLMCLALTVSAIPGKSAGVYGHLGGLQSWTNDVDVSTITRITSNPDNAYLKVTVEMLNALGAKMGTRTEQSTRGVTSLAVTHVYDGYVFEDPSCVWVTHEVKGGAIEYDYSIRLGYTGN